MSENSYVTVEGSGGLGQLQVFKRFLFKSFGKNVIDMHVFPIEQSFKLIAKLNICSSMDLSASGKRVCISRSRETVEPCRECPHEAEWKIFAIKLPRNVVEEIDRRRANDSRRVFIRKTILENLGFAEMEKMIEELEEEEGGE